MKPKLNIQEEEAMKAEDIAGDIGRGLAAGLVGTAAMTASQTIEMRLDGRSASTMPLQAAAKTLGIEDTVQTIDEPHQSELSNLVHWSYGTAWGSTRGFLNVIGIRGMPALLLHFAAIWGTALIVEPGLGVSKPVTQWKPQQIIISGLHHAVYALVVSLTFELLEQEISRQEEEPWYRRLFLQPQHESIPILSRVQDLIGERK